MPSGVYKHKPISEKLKKKLSQLMKGKPGRNLGKHWKLKEEVKKNMSKSHRGVLAYNWKGEYSTYSNIHKWVNKWKTRPDGCENCGETKKRMHWANKDHKYRRVLEDYIFLCPKCHYEFDKTNQLR